MELDLSYYKDKRILITGGGGYLGSKLAEFLINSSAIIFLLDLKFNAIAEKLNTDYTDVSKVVCDLTNKKEIEVAINNLQPDLIFHFAALLNRERDFSNYEKLYKVNVEGTLNLLDALKGVCYAGFYFASSSEVYGNKNPSPFYENQYPMPASPYSLTKLMAENLISTYSQIYSKPYAILRLFNFYGPQMAGDFFLSQLEYSLQQDIPFEMTNGEQKRDYINIHDLVILLAQVATKPGSNEQIVNLCSGKGESIRTIAEKAAELLNKKHLLKIGAKPYRSNEIWEMIGDDKKLKLILEQFG